MQQPSSRPRRHPRHSQSFRGARGDFTLTTRGRNSFPPTQARNSTREVHFDNAVQSYRSTRIPVSRARAGGRLRGLRPNHGRLPPDPEAQWFRVEIPHGESCGKDFLMRGINAQLEQPVVPYSYHLDGTSVVFHVVGNEVAETLRSLNRRITKPDGFKLLIYLKPCSPPQSTVDESLLQLLRDVMSKRFTADLSYLDLSGFRKDESFVSKELYVPLDRPVILKEVVKILQQNIPGLTILNLADNRIRSLESLSSLKTCCSSLKAVNLSKNMITSIAELEHLKGLSLEELWMQGNPCANAKDKTSFIRLSTAFLA